MSDDIEVIETNAIIAAAIAERRPTPRSRSNSRSRSRSRSPLRSEYSSSSHSGDSLLYEPRPISKVKDFCADIVDELTVADNHSYEHKPEHVALLTAILKHAGIEDPSSPTPDEVTIYRKRISDDCFYKYTAATSSDAGRLRVYNQSHRCYSGLRRLKACRSDPNTHSLTLFTDSHRDPTGTFLLVERVSNLGLFQGCCNSFPLIIANHSLAECLSDPDHKKRDSGELRYGNDGCLYQTSFKKGLKRFLKAQTKHKSLVMQGLVNGCLNLSTAHPLHAPAHDTNPHTFLLRPHSVLADAIENKFGYCPFIYAQLFSLIGVQKLADKFLMPEHKISPTSLAFLVTDSCINVDTLAPFTLDSTVYNLTESQNGDRYIVHFELIKPLAPLS